MVGSGSGGAYTSNNALLALWLEFLGDDAYDTSCWLMKGMVLQVWMLMLMVQIMNDSYGLE